ncbi:MAG: PfkB family carbohydrate kinase [Candidatus Sumerlaeia bacterium]|nr:PfkB family carbohydrate kinase [Candidatus Sumerlaeia bacterium]
MNSERLETLLSAFPQLSIAVLGDFFLDKYLDTDPALREVSLETGLDALQVVRVRTYPGAAGTVLNNLVALGIGRLFPVGFTGTDGQAYDLRRGMAHPAIVLDDLLERSDRLTPAYVKLMEIQPDGAVREFLRFDIKNRTPLPPDLEDAILARLSRRLADCNGLIIADQVQEANCGVVTDRVREAVAQLGGQYPHKVVFADSRVRIGRFCNVIVKPNRSEGARAVGLDESEAEPEAIVRRIACQTGRPACVTLGEGGVLAFDGQTLCHIPAYLHEGPVDIVGAGDSLTAGMVSALCAGVTFFEAALIGNLVASITVQQIGVTGTATPAQVRERFEQYRRRFPALCEHLSALQAEQEGTSA